MKCSRVGVELKEEFVSVMPGIVAYLKSAFRGVWCLATRDDKISDGVALCWKWFVAAKQKGKEPSEFVVTMARFAARAVRAGRTVCGQQKAKDVLSLTARIRHGVAVEHLGCGVSHSHALYDPASNTPHRDPYEEFLAENTTTPVPDQVAFRIDWPAFVASLPERDRELMDFLGLGNSNQDAADAFDISPGRVSQLRKGWSEKWRGWGAASERRCRR